MNSKIYYAAVALATIPASVFAQQTESSDVCIPDKIKVNLNAKESIEITNGFICEKGATLTINAQ